MSGFLLLHGALRIEDARAAPDDVIFVPCGALAAVASRLDRAEALEDADEAALLALRHNRILTEIAATRDVAPIALGAVASGVDQAAALIATQAAMLERALARISGAVEFGVRVFGREGAAADPAAIDASAATGRSYLAARKDALDARRRRSAALEAFYDDAERKLGRHARAGLRLTPPQAQPGQRPRLLELAFLTPRGQADALVAEGAQVYAAAAELGLELEVSGPWPAYHFAREESEAAA